MVEYEREEHENIKDDYLIFAVSVDDVD